MTLGKVAALSIALFGSAQADGVMSFDSFVSKYGRSYDQGSAEYKERQSLYEQLKAAAEVHNAQPDRLWNAGVNKLWDYTAAEFKQLRGWDGSVMPEGGSSRSIKPHTAAFLQHRSALPDQKLWDNITAAHTIKNQGACGSCWAIASATVLEAHTEIYSGKFRSFSAQQIVECTPNPRKCGGDGGCQGATAELAMEWVLHNGCADEDEEPYMGQDGSCKAQQAPALAQIDGVPAALGASSFGMVGWETLPKNQYEPLARALVERGPVAVSVAANDWQMYDDGIFDGCGKDAIIDHAVTAMGYGVENGVKFWKIQNSWGDDWGEAGHIRIQRHDQDTYCGMNNKPELGVACKDEDLSPKPVCGMCGILFDSVVPHFQSQTVF